VHPAGVRSARAAGALNKRKSSPASNVTQTKGALGLRKADNAVSLWDEKRDG
jgi:hypothetical protein